MKRNRELLYVGAALICLLIANLVCWQPGIGSRTDEVDGQIGDHFRKLERTIFG